MGMGNESKLGASNNGIMFIEYDYRWSSRCSKICGQLGLTCWSPYRRSQTHTNSSKSWWSNTTHLHDINIHTYIRAYYVYTDIYIYIHIFFKKKHLLPFFETYLLSKLGTWSHLRCWALVEPFGKSTSALKKSMFIGN